jgi:predicted CopG family antitoxin
MNKLENLHKLTSISLSKENYDKLKRLGYTGESFNDVLSRVLENVKEESRYIQKMRKRPKMAESNKGNNTNE